MADETAASSTAEVDVFNGQEPTLAEYSHYRQSGEVPERFKPAEKAEPAAAATSEETTESEAEEAETESESETEETTQEQPQKGAEKRIKQLLAQKKELERKLEAAAKPTQQSASSPAQQPQAPQNYQEYRAAFKPAEWIAKYAEKNPQATYEDANAAMADHLADARDHFRNIETRVNAEKSALEAKVSEARERYEDFDEIKTSFLAKVLSDKGMPLIPLPVLALINDSDVMADLLYTIGSDEAELAKFVDMAKVNPNKAIRYVARVENLIAEELAKPEAEAKRGEDGKFTKNAPEPKKTAAPKPPSPVSGASSRAFDVSDESLSPEEWMRKRTADLDRRRKS